MKNIISHLPVVFPMMHFAPRLVSDFDTRTPVVRLARGVDDRPPADLICFKIPIHDALPAAAPRRPASFPSHGVLIKIYSFAVKRSLDGAKHPMMLLSLVGSGRYGLCQVHRELVLPVPLSPVVRHHVQQMNAFIMQ